MSYALVQSVTAQLPAVSANFAKGLQKKTFIINTLNNVLRGKYLKVTASFHENINIDAEIKTAVLY